MLLGNLAHSNNGREHLSGLRELEIPAGDTTASDSLTAVTLVTGHVTFGAARCYAY